MAKSLKIRDLTLRDGQQSSFATRMTQEQINRCLPYYKDAGFYAMEVWGGAVPDSVMRYLGENPWTRLETIYKAVGDVSKCDGCMTCVGKCPMEAIPADAPCTTIADRCIACGRCVVVCPQGARGFGGEAYKGFEAKFTAAFSQRREPETFFAG